MSANQPTPEQTGYKPVLRALFQDVPELGAIVYQNNTCPVINLRWGRELSFGDVNQGVFRERHTTFITPPPGSTPEEILLAEAQAYDGSSRFIQLRLGDRIVFPGEPLPIENGRTRTLDNLGTRIRI